MVRELIAKSEVEGKIASDAVRALENFMSSGHAKPQEPVEESTEVSKIGGTLHTGEPEGSNTGHVAAPPPPPASAWKFDQIPKVDLRRRLGRGCEKDVAESSNQEYIGIAKDIERFHLRQQQGGNY